MGHTVNYNFNIIAIDVDNIYYEVEMEQPAVSSPVSVKIPHNLNLTEEQHLPALKRELRKLYSYPQSTKIELRQKL